MRASLDGSNLETLIDTSKGDSRPGRTYKKWCVGIVLDTAAGKLYWTQKGSDNAGEGQIFRAELRSQRARPRQPQRYRASISGPSRTDRPRTLPCNRTMYWNRGDPPRGNTVNRAPMDQTSQGNGKEQPVIIFDHLMEGIGIALDLKHGRMFLTDLGGSVYSANLDGSNKKTVLAAEGNLTGIAYAEIPGAQITPP